ncbi:MAG: discoidin domain-containing protein, partial [Armatimonadetes bacterium]|nr:discoidin domain-containing protein [Armatimonadota bacterium]
VVLEDQRRIAGTGAPAFSISAEESGRKRFAWLLYEGPEVPAAETALARGFSLRWGICVSAMRQESIAIGQRVAHWQEGQADLMSFPSDAAIEAMALAGVSTNVLHLYWSKGWGRQFVPVDEPELRRWVRSCWAHGIRPVLYVVPVDAPGVDGINSEWYRDYGVGGLYFDFGAVGYNTARYKTDYPAMQYLRLTRHYRDVVGEEGLMISHCSGQFPDLVFMRNIDAYLPGEVMEHRRMLDGWDMACWFGGQAAGVSHPWCEYKEWQTKHAAAIFAAIGAFPHVLFGRGTHQDNNYHRCIIFPAHFVLPYWQMLRMLPADGKTVMYNEATQPVASTTGRDVHWTVYSRGRDGLMVVVSNLGDSEDVVVQLDKQKLGLQGQFAGWLLFDDVLKAPETLRWDGGAIRIGVLNKDDYRAVVLVRRGSALAAYAGRQLEALAELRRQLTNKTPPSPVTNLRASAMYGMVELQWDAAAGPAHVCEYRISRSDAAVELPAAEECTYARDFTAPPGERVRYEIRAADIAGNVGPPASVEVAVPKGDVLCATFADGLAGLRPVSGLWTPRDGWLEGDASWPVARPDGDTFTFDSVEGRFIRLYFSGGRFNFGAAHVIEAQVFGPDGKALPVAAVSSSGDDTGHPVSDVIDGITDQARNGWWSDRRKGLPAWVTLDLGQAVRVAKIWVLTYADGKRWYDYRVEVSADGRQWKVVGQSERPPLALCLGPEIPSHAAVSVAIKQVENHRVTGGLVFGADAQGRGYALVVDDTFDGYLRLAQVDGRALSMIQGQPFGYSMYRPLPYLLDVRLRERHVECRCNGQLVFERDLPDWPGQHIGLVCKGGRLLFDNLQAWAVGRAGTGGAE